MSCSVACYSNVRKQLGVIYCTSKFAHGQKGNVETPSPVTTA